MLEWEQQKKSIVVNLDVIANLTPTNKLWELPNGSLQIQLTTGFLGAVVRTAYGQNRVRVHHAVSTLVDNTVGLMQKLRSFDPRFHSPSHILALRHDITEALSAATSGVSVLMAQYKTDQNIVSELKEVLKKMRDTVAQEAVLMGEVDDDMGVVSGDGDRGMVSLHSYRRAVEGVRASTPDSADKEGEGGGA